MYTYIVHRKLHDTIYWHALWDRSDYKRLIYFNANRGFSASEMHQRFIIAL